MNVRQDIMSIQGIAVPVNKNMNNDIAVFYNIQIFTEKINIKTLIDKSEDLKQLLNYLSMPFCPFMWLLSATVLLLVRPSGFRGLFNAFTLLKKKKE